MKIFTKLNVPHYMTVCINKIIQKQVVSLYIQFIREHESLPTNIVLSQELYNLLDRLEIARLKRDFRMTISVRENSEENYIILTGEKECIGI